MQFKTLFALLLASLLFGVDAAPISSDPGSITLPLQRAQHTRRDIHPLINFQQHYNHAVRRWMRLTDRSLPSDEELVQNLHKRILSVEGEEGLFKRYNRMGVPSRKKKLGTKGINLATGIEPQELAVPNSVTVSNTPKTPHSLGLDIEANDVAYLAIVQIGTPSRNFLLLMDSGSSDTWVGGENCKSEAGGDCGNHTFLGPQSSSSFRATQNTFQVTYGTGHVAGTIVHDNLSFGNFTLPGHTFGVADSESVQFSDKGVPFDGLMGLAQSKLSQQKVLTPVDALVETKKILRGITSIRIPRFADGKRNGQITFGALDNTMFDPETLVTLDNVSKIGFWEAAMDAVSINGKDARLQGRSAIFDTGTTLIVAPQADATTVHQLIPGAKSIGQGGFTVPCTTNASVALTFKGRRFSIDPRDLAFQPIDPTKPNGDCISGITAGSIGDATEWLVGDVFLKNVIFSMDTSKNVVELGVPV